MDTSTKSVSNFRAGVNSKLELMNILENNSNPSSKMWALLTAIQCFEKQEDNEQLSLVCSKLYNIENLRLDFFIPQLCQIVMDRGKQAMPLARFLIDQCRRSVRSALLIYFAFNGAVQDNSPEKLDWYKQLLRECFVASVSSNKNNELNKLFPLYRYHVERHTAKPITPREEKVDKDSKSYLRVKGEPEVQPNVQSEEVVNLTEEQLAIIETTVKHITDIDLTSSVGGILEDFDSSVLPSSQMIYAKNLNEKALKQLDLFSDLVLQITESEDDSSEFLSKVKDVYECIQNCPYDEKTTDNIFESANSSLLTGKNNRDNRDKTLFEEVISRRMHKEYFNAQLRFIEGLSSISTMLVNLQLKTDKAAKNYALRLALKKLNNNKDFLKGVYIPIFHRSGIPYRVIRIPHAEALALNSRDRVPFMLNLEVVSGLVELGLKSKELSNSSKTEKKDSPKVTPNSEVKSEDNKDETKEKKSETGLLNINLDYLAEGNTISSDISANNKKITPKVIKAEEDDWVCLENNEPDVLDKAFGPNWETRKERLRLASPVGNEPGWDLISVIVKSGDDLRQEQLAMQLISVFAEVFHEENLPLWLNPYMVLSTSSDAGLLETVHDAISIHGLKKSLNIDSLRTYFLQAYGVGDSPRFIKAQTNFCESLAAYSLVCYLLQIKDRHNGNIMIDREGHIIHIDYGFMLSSSPGNLQFESAPFKLPMEFVDVMGGKDSDKFAYFRCVASFCCYLLLAC
eukprot:TRINITY_DN3215_c0_g1_i1.p1 TRINITY_DN3215_c0_g1~~TRINITY_DN3215_c0_g1_i1.p1  ORF type:complete len:748 (+),score=138.45 TRINITY_DN3215_c0_g1_i1:23-2245(+)